MTTPDRIALALAACEGLSDAELAKRGPGGFKAMIERKRAYAHAARHNYAAGLQLMEVATKTAKELQGLKTLVETLEKMDQPVGDVSEAAALLAGISKSGGAV